MSLRLSPAFWLRSPPLGFGGWITALRQVQLLTFKSTSWKVFNAFLATCNTVKLLEKKRKEKKKSWYYLPSQFLQRPPADIPQVFGGLQTSLKSTGLQKCCNTWSISKVSTPVFFFTEGDRSGFSHKIIKRYNFNQETFNWTTNIFS